jgi:hypothetical protein
VARWREELETVATSVDAGYPDNADLVLEQGGTRLDADDRVVYGLRPRCGLLTAGQRLALDRHRGAEESLSETAARGLYAVALLDLLYAEFTLALGAPAATELQQQGLVRRRPSGTYFQATDDVRFSLLLDESPHSR